MDCEKYATWQKNNVTRQNLVNFAPSEASASSASKISVENDASYNDTLSLIDELLPGELRSDYLRLRAGVTIPTTRRDKVRLAIADILGVDYAGTETF